jgi:hypothetical protein
MECIDSVDLPSIDNSGRKLQVTSAGRVNFCYMALGK